MASLISRTISQLFGGVSQQPAQLRSDSQCELQDNCWPDVAVGLSKRPPCLNVAKLNTDSTLNKAVHFINRDGSERYVVAAKSGEVKVYDLDGNEKTVTAPDGLSYLTTSDPKTDLAFLTVADTTFIVNRSVTVAMDAAAAYTPHNEYFVYVYTAVASHVYNVYLDGNTYSYTTGTVQTETIAQNLLTSINAGGLFTAVRSGSTLKIVKNAGGTFSGSVSDSYGNQAIRGFRSSIEHSSQLPPDFWSNFIIKIRGSLESGADDFYVTFDSTDKVWKETVAGGLQNSFTASTMPHKLVRNGDGSFTFSKITWDPRAVGDEDSNPTPSFVGLKLNNVFFFRERLGLLAGENAAMSRTSDYFNFFATTASGVTDDDPIDITVADTRVSQLYHALSFQESLLVFSDTAQFQLTGGDVLSPKTARLDATTRFYTSKTISPLPAGRDVYFTVDRGDSTSVREYFVLPDGISTDAADVTAHVPAYVPKNIGAAAGSTLLDAVFLYSRDSANKLYIYKYLWSGDQKVQSAWGTATFDSDVSIIGMYVFETVLYLCIVRADGTYLEKIDFQSKTTETGMNFRVHLDRRYSLTGAYSAGTGKTTWTLPNADTADYQVILGASFGTKAGAPLSVTKVSSTEIEATGDFSTGSCFVGKPYTMRYRFTQLHIKDQEKNAVLEGRLQLKRMQVSYTDTGSFRIEVTPYQRETNIYKFTGIVLGTIASVIGKVNISSGVFPFPVITRNLGVTIDIVSTSHLPANFQSATWEGLYATKSRKV